MNHGMTDRSKPKPKTKPKVPRGKPGVVAGPGSTRQPSTAKFAAEGMGVAAKE